MENIECYEIYMHIKFVLRNISWVKFPSVVCEYIGKKASRVEFLSACGFLQRRCGFMELYIFIRSLCVTDVGKNYCNLKAI